MDMQTYFTRDQALQKVKHYCAYQERCHKEVKEKLYGYGLHKAEVEELISELIQEGYLNEERFAIEFAGGKFRMKHWGRVKIKHELKQRQVSDYCIKKALAGIDEIIYLQTLQKLAEQKWKTINEKNPGIKKKKLQSYILQKGFESNLLPTILSDLEKKTSGG